MKKSSTRSVAAINRWKKFHAKQKEQLSRAKPEDIAALCGFIAGDGSVVYRALQTHTRYDISFYPDDRMMLEKFLNLVKSIYDLSASVTNRGKFYEVQLTSKVVGMHLKSIAPTGTEEWRIPQFKTQLETINWIRAFFSAEAYVGLKSIRVQTTNKQGMLQLSRHLSALEINHNSYVYHPKKINHSTVHIITILQKSSRQRYKEIIGFWHASKNFKIRNMFKNAS